MGSLLVSALLFVVVFGGSLVQSQTDPATGSATGTVRAIDGAVIPGAVISVAAGGKRKTTVSNQLGIWKIDGLKPGNATGYAKLGGFVTRYRQMQIVAGQAAEWNVTLRPGQSFQQSLEPVGLDPTDPALAAGVYSVVLRRMVQGSLQKPTVVTTSLIVPYIDEEWPETFRMLPDAVRRGAGAPDAQKPVMLRAESLPPQAKLIDHRTRSDSPTARLSRVFFSEDQLGALVVFEQACPNHCGRGELLWLQRKTKDDKWKVHTAQLLWVE